MIDGLGRNLVKLWRSCDEFRIKGLFHLIEMTYMNK
jgi:hypothetical protein